MTKITHYEYGRKSTSDKDEKQVLSLESQHSEMMGMANKKNIKIDHYLQESKSAKKPGRPIFNQMMNEIEKTKTPCSIICWHANRLTRNNDDMAWIIRLVDSGKLLEIITPIQTFRNTPIDKFMFGFWCLQSKLDNDNKSIDISRGMRCQATRGFYPIQAPLGWVSNKAESEKDLLRIPTADFPLLQKAIHMILNRTHTPAQALDVLNNVLLVRNKKGNKINKSSFYKNFLKNTFLYGEYEYPKGSGNWMKGSHKPICTKTEWQEIQNIVEGNRTSPIKPQTKEFVFGNGMMNCGECGSKIIAYDKTKNQKNGIVRNYIYNECKDVTECSQTCTEEKSLHLQVLKELEKIEVPKEIHDLVMSWVKRENSTRSKEKDLQIDNLTKRYKTIETSLDGLIDMKASNLIPTEKYTEKFAIYTKERDDLKFQIDTFHSENTDWLELVDKMFTFAEYGKKMYQTPDLKLKRNIIRAFGSNLTLKDKILIIDKDSWVYPLQEIVKKTKEIKPLFEPRNQLENKGLFANNEVSAHL